MLNIYKLELDVPCPEFKVANLNFWTLAMTKPDLVDSDNKDLGKFCMIK